MDVFFYGQFMDKSLLKSKGLNPTNPRVSRLDGYGLRIGERASLLQSEAERVYGIIMSLSNEELNVLYSEKSVSDYVPELVTVTTENKEQIDVTAYNLPAELVSGRNKEYADSLAILAERIGLPSEYVDEIKRQAP